MDLRRLLLTSTAAVAFIAAQNVRAEGPDIIVITATAIPTPLREIGSSVSVLTKDDLDRQGDTFAIDALRTLPGVGITENGGPGGLASVRIRGEEAYRTVILIDGIRISDPAGTQVATNLTSALASDVGRIEVVRGPQSLLYGADAVGGVIQIFTPDPAPGFAVDGEGQAGAYRTRSASATALYGGSGWSGVLQGSYYKDGGFSATDADPALEDPDGLESYTFHGKADIDLTSNLKFEAVGRYAYSNGDFDGASAFPPFSPADPDRHMRTKETAGRFALDDSADNNLIHTTLAYVYSASDRNDIDNGMPFSFGSKFDGQRNRFEAQSAVQVAHDQTILVGADQETLRVQTDSFDERSSEYGVFGEWQAGFADRFFTTLGARFDHGDDIHDHVSGRATAAYLVPLFSATPSRFHASIGTGFRAPSLYEQAYNVAAAVPKLHEEESRGWDFGLEQYWFGGDLTLDVTYFDQQIRDEIRFDNISFLDYFQQPGVSSSRGVETALHGQKKLDWGWVTGARLDLAYTYTDSRVHSPDAEDGLPRIRGRGT